MSVPVELKESKPSSILTSPSFSIGLWMRSVPPSWMIVPVLRKVTKLVTRSPGPEEVSVPAFSKTVVLVPAERSASPVQVVGP